MEESISAELKSIATGEEIEEFESEISNTPFYGIWCASSKDQSEAENAANLISQQGFNGQVFVTTDWRNLNSEKWYVVTAGVYLSKEEADAMLSNVQTVYPGSYIKYSGDWIGQEKSAYNESSLISKSDIPPLFTDEQLKKIVRELGVPDNINVTITQNTPLYWEAGECWINYVSISSERGIAGADIDCYTLETVKEILTYSEDY